jgi:error-prone DNA polymerase
VVSGLGEERAKRIAEERRRQEFTSLEDFLARTRLPLAALQGLAMGDAFTCFGLSQREALWRILSYQVIDRMGAQAPSIQGNLFAGHSFTGSKSAFSSLSDVEAIHSDFEAYGLSTRGHPLGALRKQFPKQIPHPTTADAKRTPHGKGVRLAGLVIARQRPQTAKGTCFATLEDETGFIDLVLHESVYEEYREVFRSSPFVIVSAKSQRDREGSNAPMSLIVHRVETLTLEFPDPAMSANWEAQDFSAYSHDFR